jgi:hypothetical protein
MTNEDKQKARKMAKRIRLDCCGANGEIAENCSASEVEGWIADIIIAALSEARVEGEAAGIERAAKAMDVCTCGSGPEFRAINMRHHVVCCLMHVATMIRTLSPDSGAAIRAAAGDEK